MRLQVILALVLCAVAAGCGGGGGGAPPIIAPTFASQSQSQRPHGDGDSFTYAGTLAQTFVRPPLARQPIPSPNPTSSQTLTYAVAQTVGVRANATFAAGVVAQTGLIDEHTVETDTQSVPFEQLETTSDSYYAFLPAGAATNVTLVGVTAATSSGTSTTTIYGAGNGLVDVLPEVPGPLSPGNGAALTVVESDPQHQTSTKTIAADGSYVERFTYPTSATPGTATANADGSGSFSFPALGLPSTVFVVGAPTATGGGAPAIPITITYPAGLFPPVEPSASPTPTVVHRTVAPAWFTPPVQLSSETLVTTGPAALPVECAVPTSLSKPANAIVQTIATIDPVFGENDRRTTTTYDETGIGVACVRFVDVLQQYYDFSGQTTSLIRTSADGTPVQTTTTTQTLGITQASVLGRDVRALGARFDAVLARARQARRAAVWRAVRQELHR